MRGHHWIRSWNGRKLTEFDVCALPWKTRAPEQLVFYGHRFSQWDYCLGGWRKAGSWPFPFTVFPEPRRSILKHFASSLDYHVEGNGERIDRMPGCERPRSHIPEDSLAFVACFKIFILLVQLVCHSGFFGRSSDIEETLICSHRSSVKWTSWIISTNVVKVPFSKAEAFSSRVMCFWLCGFLPLLCSHYI